MELVESDPRRDPDNTPEGSELARGGSGTSDILESSSNSIPSNHSSSNGTQKHINGHSKKHDKSKASSSHVQNDQHIQEETTEGASDPDPLEIRQLALSYDYLIYRIHDHISTLSDTTYQAITEKQPLIEHDYLEQQLGLAQQMTKIDMLIGQCKELEMDFLKLDQLGMFLEDFRARLEVLEREFSDLEG